MRMSAIGQFSPCSCRCLRTTSKLEKKLNIYNCSKWPLLFYRAHLRKTSWNGRVPKRVYWVFCRPGTIKSKAVLFKLKTTEHVQSVIKAKEMTFNFYVRAKNLQIQGKENANQLRVELVNLARTNNLNDSVATVTKNKTNKMASKLPAPATMKDMKKTTPWPITIYTVYLNSSMSEGPYVSYLNTRIATINDELKNIKTLLNFYRLLRRYFRTCCQQTSTRERQHKTRINWINPHPLGVAVGEGVVPKKPPPPPTHTHTHIKNMARKRYIRSKNISCHIPLLINKKCTPFPYSNRTFLALWEGRERADSW